MGQRAGRLRRPHRLGRDLADAVEPHTAGAYVNFIVDTGADRVRTAYPPAIYDRLAPVKRRYDPANVFRLNQNIPPADA